MITFVYVYGCLCMWCFGFVMFVGVPGFAEWFAWWCFGLCDPFCLILGAVWLITCGMMLLVGLFANGLRL